MSKSNVSIAEGFYTMMGEKNVEGLEKYLHPDVQFRGPLTQIGGKEAYSEIVRNFTSFLRLLKFEPYATQEIKSC